MVFWIAIAALTAAATAALLAPLFRAHTPRGAHQTEIAIYRDQLDEIERDVDRGVLPESEAKAARAEIGRRLLQAGEAPEPSRSEPPRRRRIIVWAVVVFIPVACLGAYFALGSPDDKDQPFAVRLTNPHDDDLFARLQLAQTRDSLSALQGIVDVAVAKTPDDARILQAAVLIYLAAQRLDDAYNTYTHLIDIAGADVDPSATLAMMIGQNLLVGVGPGTPAADDMFNRVLAVDPTNPVARLYLAVGMQARGENDAAVAAYLDLLQDEPAGGADWADFAREALAELGAEAPPPPASAPASAPAAASAGAPNTADFTPEQMAMINQMVDGLATQLAADPNNADGWAQLIRSYIVLGRTDDARAALMTARDVFTGNAEALAAIEEAAAPLGDAE